MSSLVRGFTRWYAGKLGSRLSRLGLTYHDAVAESGIYEKAIGRLPPAQQVERARRIKRAFDLSAKHVDIPVAARENPWREFKQVDTLLAATQKEADERAVLSGRPFIPFNLGRDLWWGYDRSKAWWWSK